MNPSKLVQQTTRRNHEPNSIILQTNFLDQDYPVKSIEFDDEGYMWGVGTDGTVSRTLTNINDLQSWDFNQFKGTWNNQGKLGGWYLTMVTFDLEGCLWCVGPSGDQSRVGQWSKKPTDKSSWDNNNQLQGEWIEQKKVETWTLKMISFGRRAPDKPTKGSARVIPVPIENLTNDMWCVGSEGNVGKWDKDPGDSSNWNGDQLQGKWKDQGKLGKWKWNWITFHPWNDTNGANATGEANDYAWYDFSSKEMSPIDIDWDIKMSTYAIQWKGNYYPDNHKRPFLQEWFVKTNGDIGTIFLSLEKPPSIAKM